jgi:hypothetical protein
MCPDCHNQIPLCANCMYRATLYPQSPLRISTSDDVAVSDVWTPLTGLTLTMAAGSITASGMTGQQLFDCGRYTTSS